MILRTPHPVGLSKLQFGENIWIVASPPGAHLLLPENGVMLILNVDHTHAAIGSEHSPIIHTLCLGRRMSFSTYDLVGFEPIFTTEV